MRLYRLILFSTGRLLLAFLLGSAMTLVGSAAAMALLPLGPWMGEAGWKVATALTARHIGGAVNYMAVSEQLAVPPSVFGEAAQRYAMFPSKQTCKLAEQATHVILSMVWV